MLLLLSLFAATLPEARLRTCSELAGALEQRGQRLSALETINRCTKGTVGDAADADAAGAAAVASDSQPRAVLGALHWQAARIACQFFDTGGAARHLERLLVLLDRAPRPSRAPICRRAPR